MTGRSSAFALALVVSFAVGGCGSAYSIVSINAADARVEQARALGAETKAPYEYTYAREHLRQARVEAGEASYSDAAAYAETAEAYAQRAIDRIRGRRPGTNK
jgi:hypothetical protein